VKKNSFLNKKKTEAYCKEAREMSKKLNNGRSCQHSWQCVSQDCRKGVCTALHTQEPCYSHSDCGPKNYCKKYKKWPYVSKCQALRK